jgi:sugar lactone lactonase YvrE
MEKIRSRSNNPQSAGAKILILLVLNSYFFLTPYLGFSATFVSGLSYPTGIAIHPNERSLYVNSGSSGTVWKIPIKANGSAGTISVVTDQFVPVAGVVFDANGNLYGVSEYSADTYAFILSTGGSVCASKVTGEQIQSFPIAIESPGLSNNRMFLIGDSNDLRSAPLSFVTCQQAFYNGDIKIGELCGQFRYFLYRPNRADLVGTYGDKVVSVNIGNGSCSTLVSGLIQPNGLAEDAEGNLFIADTGAGKIFKRDILGVTSEIAKGLNGPTGLFFDSETGLLFISETNAGKIIAIPESWHKLGRIILKVKDSSNQWSDAFVAPGLKSPTSPAACVDDSNILYVFASNEDGFLYMSKRTPAGAWSTWAKVPGNLKTDSNPTVVHNNGRILLYVRGPDDKVWESIYTISTKKWTAWRAVSGIKTPESPDVTSDSSGNIYLFTRGIR